MQPAAPLVPGLPADDPFYTPTRTARADEAPANVQLYASRPPAAFSESPKARINGEDTPSTFFARAGSGTDIVVSAGVLNNVVYGGGTLTSPSVSDLIWIEATVTSGTDTVTAVTVAKGASVPADTATKAHTVIGDVPSITGGVVKVRALAWNYSQLQKCGSFRWGGFGG